MKNAHQNQDSSLLDDIFERQIQLPSIIIMKMINSINQYQWQVREEEGRIR
jgi:hypothetical protein